MVHDDVILWDSFSGNTRGQEMDFDDIILWDSTQRIRQAKGMDFANVTLKHSFSANSGMGFDNVTL